jgi:hypothetical protein
MTSAVGGRPAATWAFPVLIVLSGWPGCGAGERITVATLLEAQGVVERSDGAGWRGVAPGFGFAVDDALRTGPRSSAQIGVVGGSRIRLGENARLRFKRGAPGEQTIPAIGVDLGVVEIEPIGSDLLVVTAAGSTRIDRAARVRLNATGQTTTLEVVVGRAVLLGGEGESAVRAGEGLTFRIGGAIVERFHVKVGQAAIDRDAQVHEPSVPGGDAETAAEAVARIPARAPVKADAEGAERADVTFAAGETATVHDDRPGLPIRLRFNQLCSGPGGGIVEMVAKGRRRERLAGTDAVVFRLRAGANSYRLRCAGDSRGSAPRAAGVLTLRRDSGHLPLSRRAPANTIDSDGRRYTVLYQTRPPALTLAWSGGAKLGDLELHLESSAGERVLPVRTASHRLAPGVLAEGTHTWWYVTRDGVQSPKTTVTISFDNTAPNAQFFRAPSVAAPAGSVAIDGVVVEGVKITAAGKSLAIDDRGRFRTAVSPLDGDDAVAVRLDHPQGGVHYYVRRRPGTR